MNRPFVISIIGFVAAAAAVTLALALDSADEPVSAMPPAESVPAVSGRGAPGFDVVRVGEKGDAMLAGHAVPGAEVRIRDGGRDLGKVAADARGEWVFVPTVPLPAGARALTLSAGNPDGSQVDGAAPVILVVLDQGGPALALKPLAGGGAVLLNGPAGEPDELGIALLDRDDTGRLFVGGRAPVGAVVRLYVDAHLLGRTEADGEGAWRLRAEAPAAARSLRAELVDDRGTVQARVDIPYDTDPPSAAGEGTISVVAGGTPWRIARRLPGDGGAVTVVFESGERSGGPVPGRVSPVDRGD